MGRLNELFCDYLGRTENFADFWNGTLFRGIPLLRSKCFTRQDREYHKSLHKEGKAGIHRDVLMQYQDAGIFLLGVEVMDTLDYSIPVRIVDYDAQELLRQIKDISSANRQAVKDGLETWENSGEFLYGIKKEDKLFPIHTVALYRGTDDYDGQESVLKMTEYEKLAPEVKALFVDYPINLYQLKDLSEENYQTSLREIIAVFKRSRNREEVKKYYLEHKKRFGYMDELSIDLMGELIGNRKLKMFQQENGGVDVCKAFEDEREEGRLEGRLEGEETLRQAISNLMKNLKMSFGQAMEAMGIPQSEWEKYEQV